MTVDEVIELGRAAIGKVITIRGHIFVLWNDDWCGEPGEEVCNDFFVAPDAERWNDKEDCLFIDREKLELEIQDSGIKMRAGGPNGGGLSDPCELTGTIAKSGCKPFPLAISSITALTIGNRNSPRRRWRNVKLTAKS